MILHDFNYNKRKMEISKIVSLECKLVIIINFSTVSIETHIVEIKIKLHDTSCDRCLLKKELNLLHITNSRKLSLFQFRESLASMTDPQENINVRRLNEN